MNVPLAPLEYEPPDGLEFDPETHTYTYHGIPLMSVTRALREVGLIRYDGIDPWFAERGTRVHALCDRNDLGAIEDNDTDLEELGVYLERWRDYLRDTGPTILGIEVPVMSKEIACAGTIDRIVKIDGRVGILDIKSGSAHGFAGLQVAGYALIGAECGIRADFCCIVELCRPGSTTYRVSEYSGDALESMKKKFHAVSVVAQLLETRGVRTDNWSITRREEEWD